VLVVCNPRRDLPRGLACLGANGFAVAMIDPDSDLHRLTPTALQLAAYAEHRLRGAELQFVELWLVRHPAVLEDVLHARLAWMDGDLGPVEWQASLRTRQFQRESARLGGKVARRIPELF
jgi:hypothetical protein